MYCFYLIVCTPLFHRFFILYYKKNKFSYVSYIHPLPNFSSTHLNHIQYYSIGGIHKRIFCSLGCLRVESNYNLFVSLAPDCLTWRGKPLSVFVKLDFWVVQRYKERQHFGFFIAGKNKQTKIKTKKKCFKIFLLPAMLSR